ncbi:MAG: hypothetical protein EPO26_18755 [Chloroflexota bacterium]|nr:MAG: hypothetical protein EPO26_18755 [Chloroflexota bacterium]
MKRDDSAERAERGELIDMSGRRLREPVFPRLTRQTPIQRVFLKRLQRLVLLNRYGQRHLAFSEQENLLLKKAIYSVFQDSADLGVQREARAILDAQALTTDRSDD